jgi:hypothetical protein
MSQKSYLRYVVFFVALLVMAVLLWPMVAMANGPVVVEVTGPSTVNVGDVFTASVVVRDSPGIFGGQFNLTFNSSYLEGVPSSLQPGAALGDILEGTRSITSGLVSYAVSRRGDVSDLTGDVTLATVQLEATGAMSSTQLCPTDVRLGAKGGNPVAVDSTTCLYVTIAEGATGASGVVMLEGSETGHWAGTTVTATLGTTVTTQTTNDAGEFSFAGIPAGDYSFEAVQPGFLAAVCPSRVITEGEMVTLNTVELLAGDIDGDGEVGILDATAIGLAFGNTGPDLVEDLNDDGEVDIIDVILLAANYGKTTQTWSC